MGAVHRCIHAAAHLVEPFAKEADLPVRFTATKLVEKDNLIQEALKIPEDEQKILEQLVEVMERESGMDREAALANMRFSFIEKLCSRTVVKPAESREHKRSVAIDRVLTGKYTAIPCFIGIMGLVFVMTFNFIGAALSDWMAMAVDGVIAVIDRGLTAAGVNTAVHSLVVDGVCQGVGSVLSFLPTIVTLFFFLSILEDTGYMARVAFVMDKLLRKIGLSGRSFVPMLIGFGCSVPAIMSARTLSSRARPEDDHSADTIYELQCQTSHLQPDDQRIFPTEMAGAGDGKPVCAWHFMRHSVCTDFEKDGI